MFRLKFDDDELGRKRYEICTQALILSSVQNGGRPIQVGEWDDVIDLLKGLKRIGTKAQKVGPHQLYDLQEGGAEILLEKAERKLLTEFIKQPMWIADGLEDAREVVQWLEKLENEPMGKIPHEGADERRLRIEGKAKETVDA